MLYFLSILYFLVGLFYIIREAFYLKKKNMLSFITTFRVMFAFIYGFLPAIVLLRLENGNSSIKLVYDKELYFSSLLFMLLVSLVEYFVISFVYEKVAYSRKHSTNYIKVSYQGQIIGISAALIIGVVSLFLWTRAFGSVFNMMQSADSVRAGYSKVYNPFAFLEHFTKVFPVCAYISFSLIISRIRQRQSFFFVLVLFLVSIVFSVISIICTDTRGSVGMIIVVLAAIPLLTRVKSGDISLLRFLATIFILLVIGYLAIVFSELVMEYIRYGKFDISETKFDIFVSLEQEFGYVINSQVAIISEMNSNPFQTMFLNDAIGAIFAWIPSRFIPFSLPISMWDYNTELLHQQLFFYGQSPTDFISSSLYMFGPFGVIVLPFIIGWFFKKIDTSLIRKTNNPYLLVFYLIFMYYCCLWWPSHFSLKYTVTILFGVFLVHLLVVLASHINRNIPSNTEFEN